MNKQTEYLTLNNQILEYERYAFERTLLIGFIGFPCLGIIDNGFYYWVPFLIMLLLLFNLNYTITNLKKAIRLKIYIQTVLEGSKTYMGFSKFLIHQEHYKKANSKEITAIQKEFYGLEDSTIDNGLIGQTKGMMIIFLILYLAILIIFMNLDSSYDRDQLLAMPLSGGILGIITFIIGLMYLLTLNEINVVTEKEIVKKVLAEV